MSSNKTIATELAVGLGLLRLPFTSTNLLRIEGVTDAAVRKALKGAAENRGLIDNMREAGIYASSRWLGSGQFAVTWSGPDQRVRAVTMPADLKVYPASSPENPLFEVSAKCESKVVLNGGVHRLMEALRNGSVPTRVSGEDWFRAVAPQELNDLYLACGGPSRTSHQTVDHFYAGVNVKQRKEFGKVAAAYLAGDGAQANSRFGRVVSQRTLEEAQRALSELNSAEKKNLLAKHLFRMGDVAYLVVGSDRGMPFAHKIPSFEDWVAAFAVDRVRLSVNPEAVQPELHIELLIKERGRRGSSRISVKFKTEIRWTHGKFCGAPEGKVYRSFRYEELPWVESA